MRHVLACVSMIATMLLTGPALAQFKTPEAAVQGLYALYEKSNSVGFSDRDAPRYFDAALQKLWRAAKFQGADFFIQGQDFEVKDVKVLPAAISGDKAETAVTFRNFGKPMRLTYTLVQGKDGWRISDARSGKETLRGTLKTASKP